MTSESGKRWSVIGLYDRLILGHPVCVVVALLVLLVVFGSWSTRFRLDASNDSLVLEHDADLRFFNQVCQRYQTQEFVFITYAPPEDLFSEPSLDRLRVLRDELRRLPHVASVTTVLDVPLLKNPPVPLKDLRGNLKTLESKGVDKALAIAELRDSPVYRNLLVSSDLRSCAIQVNFVRDQGLWDLHTHRTDLLDEQRAHTLSPEGKLELDRISAEYQRSKDTARAERHEDIVHIRAIIERHRGECLMHLGGLPMIVSDIIEFIKNDLRVFGLGMLCFLIFALGIIFRQKRWILLPLLCCVFSVTIMLGLLGLIGWEVTVVSSNFISLLLVFTIELSIYLTVRYRELRALNPEAENRKLVRRTVRSMFTPCLYCVLTTMAGFGSLVLCDILPVINFGYMMTMGLAVCMTVAFFLFPAVAMLAGLPAAQVEKELGRPVTQFLAGLAERQRPAILIMSGLVAAATYVGITRLQVENSFINYFKSSTEIYQGMKFIDQELGGTTPIEVVVNFGPTTAAAAPPNAGSGKSGDVFEEFSEFEETGKNSATYWYTTTKLELVDKVHAYMESLPAAGKVQSLATLWRVGQEINGGRPLDTFMLQILFQQMPEDFKTAMVRPYASIENNEARLVMRVKDSEPGLRRDAMIRRMRSELTDKVGLKEDQFRVTGLMVLYNNMLQSLFSSQIATIGWTFLTLSFMFLALFRSLKIAIIGMLPNVLSCMTVLGVMGLGNIPLDIMTITIVAIGMGVAVDSTIQYLYRFRKEIKQDHDYVQTMYRCHGTIGNAMYYTAGTMVVGFSILAFSNFVPSILFGLLSALAMLMSLAAAQCLLPTLIILTKPFGPEGQPPAK